MTNPPNTRLADRLDYLAATFTFAAPREALRQASALLREQDERIVELEGALREIFNLGQSEEPDHWRFRCKAREIARSSLASKEGSAARDLSLSAGTSDLATPGKGG